VDWLNANYLAYGDLLQPLDGKPLLTIIDGSAQFTPADRPLNTTQWTLRWVTSQVRHGEQTREILQA
jgi:hypothetical protein